MRRAGLAAALGAVLWGAAVARDGVGDGLGWPRALVALAALVIVPLGLGLAAPHGAQVATSAFAASLLAASTRLAPGAAAGALASPSLLATAAVAGGALLEAWRRRARGSSWPDRAALAARLFLPIGAAWALADRAGWTPFRFDATTVTLTAAHFHYAGFALALLASLAARERPSTAADLACAGVIAGVPAVAIGISATHAGLGIAIETLAVAAFGAAVFAVAAAHVGLARDPRRPRLARLLFGASSGALVLGTSLAVLYGLRGLLPFTRFDLHFMWLTHGSIQALGFSLPALLAWWVTLLAGGAGS